MLFGSAPHQMDGYSLHGAAGARALRMKSIRSSSRVVAAESDFSTLYCSAHPISIWKLAAQTSPIPPGCWRALPAHLLHLDRSQIVSVFVPPGYAKFRSTHDGAPSCPATGTSLYNCKTIPCNASICDEPFCLGRHRRAPASGRSTRRSHSCGSQPTVACLGRGTRYDTPRVVFGKRKATGQQKSWPGTLRKSMIECLRR